MFNSGAYRQLTGVIVRANHKNSISSLPPVTVWHRGGLRVCCWNMPRTPEYLWRVWGRGRRFIFQFLKKARLATTERNFGANHTNTSFVYVTVTEG